MRFAGMLLVVPLLLAGCGGDAPSGTDEDANSVAVNLDEVMARVSARWNAIEPADDAWPILQAPFADPGYFGDRVVPVMVGENEIEVPAADLLLAAYLRHDLATFAQMASPLADASPAEIVAAVDRWLADDPEPGALARDLVGRSSWTGPLQQRMAGTAPDSLAGLIGDGPQMELGAQSVGRLIGMAGRRQWAEDRGQAQAILAAGWQLANTLARDSDRGPTQAQWITHGIARETRALALAATSADELDALAGTIRGAAPDPAAIGIYLDRLAAAGAHALGELRADPAILRNDQSFMLQHGNPDFAVAWFELLAGATPEARAKRLAPERELLAESVGLMRQALDAPIYEQRIQAFRVIEGLFRVMSAAGETPDSDLPRGLLTRTIMRDPYTPFAERLAEYRATRLTIALARQRLLDDEGQYPLQLPRSIGRDPYNQDGGVLIYEPTVERDAYRIWSVGPNGRNNNGAIPDEPVCPNDPDGADDILFPPFPIAAGE